MSSLLDPCGEAAGGAVPVKAAVDVLRLQDNPVRAHVEAGLAEEMRRIGAFCRDSAERIGAIGEAAGDELAQCVAASQRLFVLELANAILQSMQPGSSLAQYVDNLGELELSVRDAFRELVLEGRKFACIALTDERAREFFRSHKAGEQGGDVHEWLPLG